MVPFSPSLFSSLFNVMSLCLSFLLSVSFSLSFPYFSASLISALLPLTAGSDCKESACKAQFQSLGWEVPLEKEMATHFSILAWKIPWTEEPGRLQSIVATVGHN